ncbi:MAG: hypothetical protein ACYTFY_16455 [Planctomycetota bacterium]|jgi:hypothetical protein
MSDIDKLKNALTEIIDHISGTMDGEDIKNIAREALESGDKDKMQEVLNRFDSLGTISIQRMRKDK